MRQSALDRAIIGTFSALLVAIAAVVAPVTGTASTSSPVGSAQLGSAGLLPAPLADTAARKKCKKGYERVGRKCKRKPIPIKPTKIVLIAAKWRAGTFSATGYAEFEKLTRIGALTGRFEIANGNNVERTRLMTWKFAAGQVTSGFTTYPTDLKFTGEPMTATLVVRGVRSNAQPLIR